MKNPSKLSDHEVDDIAHRMRMVTQRLSSGCTELEAFTQLEAMGQVLGLSKYVAFPDLFDLEHPDAIRYSQMSNLPDWFFEQVRDVRIHLNNEPALWNARLPIVLHVQTPDQFASDDTQDVHRHSNHRKILEMMQELEIRVCLMLSIHQPLGLVGFVGWGGDLSAAKLTPVVKETMPELLAFAHILMLKLSEVRQPNGPSENFPLLSRRELECLRLTAIGLHMPEIAEQLDVSATTVRHFLDTCRRKIGARNITHAVALGARYGLLGRLDLPTSTPPSA